MFNYNKSSWGWHYYRFAMEVCQFCFKFLWLKKIIVPFLPTPYTFCSGHRRKSSNAHVPSCFRPRPEKVDASNGWKRTGVCPDQGELLLNFHCFRKQLENLISRGDFWLVWGKNFDDNSYLLWCYINCYKTTLFQWFKSLCVPKQIILLISNYCFVYLLLKNPC